MDVEFKFPLNEALSVTLTVLMFPTGIEIVLAEVSGVVESMTPLLSAVQPKTRSPVAW
jgi:hypothetical protein